MTAVIRFAFWMLYNPLAFLYDLISQVVSMGHWRDWQRAALSELRGGRVLDLACGTGSLLSDLNAAGHRPVGIDLSPYMLRVARRKLRDGDPGVPLVRGRAQRLPFADDSFDSALATFPAGFIADPATLSELSRVLRPGGRLVVVMLAQLPTDSLWGRFLEFLYRVTGQRSPPPDLPAMLGKVGLSCRTMWKDVDDTAVLLMVADREAT